MGQLDPGLPGSLVLRGRTLGPALFCAPMAGFTHSAFRRLVSDFGGYGALFTEMLCGRWLLREDLARSPSARRRACEGPVVYQLMIADPADVPAVVARLTEVEPAGIDLNCACPAPHIRSAGAGSELFEDRDRLGAIVRALRSSYDGPLTVKVRLGRCREDWRERWLDRVRLLEECGVDALIVHPRFAEEKLRRRSRLDWLPGLVAETRLPVIASGDIQGPEVVRANPARFAGTAGIMVGRMAVVRPWVFRDWHGEGLPAPDYLEVWVRFARYVLEDYPEPKAFFRIRAFTRYYARNFQFGHALFAAAQASASLPELEDRATRFLAADPVPDRFPTVQGLH
jgi:tRNA-dihydrouridine synthase